LYQYRYRYYHAQLGRFLTRDWIGYADGFNIYEFTQGRPTELSDPMGLKARDACVQVGGRAGGWALVGAGITKINASNINSPGPVNQVFAPATELGCVFVRMETWQYNCGQRCGQCPFKTCTVNCNPRVEVVRTTYGKGDIFALGLTISGNVTWKKIPLANFNIEFYQPAQGDQKFITRHCKLAAAKLMTSIPSVPVILNCPGSTSLPDGCKKTCK
jgi:hypothetical protein